MFHIIFFLFFFCSLCFLSLTVAENDCNFLTLFALTFPDFELINILLHTFADIGRAQYINYSIDFEITTQLEISVTLCFASSFHFFRLFLLLVSVARHLFHISNCKCTQTCGQNSDRVKEFVHLFFKSFFFLHLSFRSFFFVFNPISFVV